jgi:amino acid transporter
MVLGAMWFCDLASVTSNSRMLFAFARDGGLPASRSVARVSVRFQSPHVAVWVSAVAAFTVSLWADAYSVMTALSTIDLYASYGIPIACGLWARRTGRFTRRGPWHLGRCSTAVNVVALIWIAVLTVLFVLPPNQLAGIAFAVALAALAVGWLGWMKKRFRGPKGNL